MKSILMGIVLGLAALAVGTAAAQPEPLRVVATTTIVADVAARIGGEAVAVTSLVPADADVHAFEPAPQDAQRVADAELVLAVGAGYESFLGDLMENAASVPLVTVNTGVEMAGFSHGHEEQAADDHAEAEALLLGRLGDPGVCEAAAHAEEGAAAVDGHEDAHGACDPHTWTDPRNVLIWADNLAAAFTAARPEQAAVFAANADRYKAELNEMFERMTGILSVVPEERRRLVTNHEFLNYFARAFDFETAGVVIPGGTTGGESDPQAVAALIDTIRELGVPAIFAEASASTQVIDVLAQDAGVTVVTTLSESLTGPEGAAPTYLDYLRVNAQTIADALQ